ncbi:ADP-ribosyltransferase [Clostridium cagae]|uniref:ADP-ribosyltransferase n=1 Tax=Clostridium cagae TaxID=2080751 RepID=UPI003F7734C0
MNIINKFIDRIRYGKMENNINDLQYIELKNDKDTEIWGRKYYNDWGKKYLNSMKVANRIINKNYATNPIEYYCGEPYKWINSYLRFGVDKSDSKIYSEVSNILAITLSMAPRIPENIILYRMVCDEFICELIRNNKKGIPTQEKGYLSTSLTKDIVNSKEYYSNHKNLLKIYVKANTVGIYVNEVTKRPENEILLSPNGYLKLIKEPYKENNKIIYECELIYMNL